MEDNGQKYGNSQVLDFLKNLDSRISRIEARLNISDSADVSKPGLDTSLEKRYNEPDSFESTLGEYWFANFGILILIIGVMLILTSPLEKLPLGLPSLIGFVIAVSVLFISYKLSDTYKYISNYLVGTGFILFYFSTLRLFHFGSQSIITNATLETLLLLALSTICIIISSRRIAPYLTAFSLTLGIATGIIIGNAYLIFIINSIISVLFVYFYIKNKWTYFLLYGMVITYFAHFIWAINNPFLGNNLQIIFDPKLNLFFILLYVVIYAASDIINKKVSVENNITISNSMINVLGSFVLYQLISISSLKNELVFFELAFFVVFFAISVVFWIKNRYKYSTSTYSLIAFISLSIAIVASTKIPDVFIYLIWQCIIVAGISIWYQSKTLTVTNFFIFLGLFFVYLFTAGTFTLISLSFGIVGLISARILNWQKQRLTLKTEFMRNTYLAIAFFTIPLTLLKSLPQNYVGLSWLAVTIIYYVLSILLKTFKYRWMAHLTLLATILYVMIFGISAMTNTFMIITIFAIGIVTSVISVMFTKRKRTLVKE